MLGRVSAEAVNPLGFESGTPLKSGWCQMSEPIHGSAVVASGGRAGHTKAGIGRPALGSRVLARCWERVQGRPKRSLAEADSLRSCREARAVSDLRNAASQADIVTCCTLSTAPLVQGACISSGKDGDQHATSWSLSEQALRFVSFSIQWCHFDHREATLRRFGEDGIHMRVPQSYTACDAGLVRDSLYVGRQ